MAEYRALHRSCVFTIATLVGLACDAPKPADTPPSPPPVVDTTLELHVVATRRGPIALSAEHGVELARAGALPILLRTTEPLALDAKHRDGLPALTEGTTAPIVDVVSFGGRWPHEATLVALVTSTHADEPLMRAVRWNGTAWERDDPIVRGVERYWTPLGPFELGTTLVLPSVEYLSDALPKHLAKRSVDGTTSQGPPMPPEDDSRFASTPDGFVFAGDHSIAMWSPGATQWQTTEMPDGTEAEINGLVALANDDVYAFGLRGLGMLDARGGYIAHYDGKTWQSMPAPNCTDGISKLVPHRTTMWAYCANENYEPRRPPETRELWRSESNGEWQRVVFELDAARVRARVLAKGEEPPPLDDAHPRATDVAITADGTLWISMSAHDGSWTLARTGTSAAVLVLPTDDEIFAAPRE